MPHLTISLLTCSNSISKNTPITFQRGQIRTLLRLEKIKEQGRCEQEEEEDDIKQEEGELISFNKIKQSFGLGYISSYKPPSNFLRRQYLRLHS